MLVGVSQTRAWYSAARGWRTAWERRLLVDATKTVAAAAVADVMQRHGEGGRAGASWRGKAQRGMLELADGSLCDVAAARERHFRYWAHKTGSRLQQAARDYAAQQDEPY